MIHDALRDHERSPVAVVGARFRWWPLARFEFRSLFRTRWGVAAFLVCLFPGLVRLTMLLIAFGVLEFGPPALRRGLQRGGAAVAALDPRQVAFYLDPVLSVRPGMVFTLLLTSLLVARTIARDRMANALELYWTRGISPLAYVFAKWLGGFLLVSVVTVAVPVALWVTAVFLAEDWTILTDSAFGMARAAVGLTLVTALWTGCCLSLSVVCGSPNAAMVAWCLLLIGSTAVGAIAAEALQEAWLRSCLSVWEAGAVLVRAIAGIRQPGASVPGAAATLGGLFLVLAALARPRLRIGEALR